MSKHVHFTRDVSECHPHIFLGACVQVSAIDGQCGAACLWPLSRLHTERLGLLRAIHVVSAKDPGQGSPDSVVIVRSQLLWMGSVAKAGLTAWSGTYLISELDMWW